MIQRWSAVPNGMEPLIIQRQFFSQSVLYVTHSEEKALETYKKCRLLSLPSFYLPTWDTIFYDRTSPSQRILNERMLCLHRLLQNPLKPFIIITSLTNFIQKVPSPSFLKSFELALYKDQNISMKEVTDALIHTGYHRLDQVREPGDFAVRGSIIDFFTPEGAYRLDWFGNNLETIRIIDPITQKSTHTIDQCVIFPSTEIFLNEDTIRHFRTHYRARFGLKGNIYESISNGRIYSGMEHFLPFFLDNKTAHLQDYLPFQTCYLMDDKAHQTLGYVYESIEQNYQQRIHNGSPALQPKELFHSSEDTHNLLNQKQTILFAPFSHESELSYDFGSKPYLPTKGFENLRNLLKEKQNILITCQSKGSCDHIHHIISELLKDWGLSPSHLKNYDHFPIFEDIPEHSSHIGLVYYPLQDSFIYKNWTILPEHALTGQPFKKSPTKKKKSFFYDDSAFEMDQLVVHRHHGIGRYQGLISISVESTRHDCIIILYADGDKLFVPVENLDLISRYRGPQDAPPSLDKLKSQSWTHRQAAAKKKIYQIAHDLIEIAAKRVLKKAPTIERNQEYERFCTFFPYSETEDQLQAINDILNDLNSGHPMDRLVCGDVGFGKTEVALRAAFCVASQGKQVMVFVPTTLLCRQHYLTFKKRFETFPYRVAQLSRFTSPKEKETILKDLKDGTVSVVIGTHSLLNDAIEYADLGLIIVDEEQHFGVKQKEKLKSYKDSVHVLTLSATPIPRTLQLGLHGIKDISLITTPPINRLSIKTSVLPMDKLVIQEAIQRELQRGGQIFYVSPRVEFLNELETRLKEWFPTLKMAVAHGKMKSTDLEKTIMAFDDHDYDLLLATHIIESGIDISNANTLIVHRADLFGLSQLYQLRGRVGRSQRQSYAYLTYKEPLHDPAEKRLKVLQSLDYLGAGFNLASYDLDLRGAGNLAGEEQSGHVKEIGIELYQQLLEEAIETLKSLKNNEITQPKNDWPLTLNLGVSVLIPESYITDLTLRLHFYRRLSNNPTQEEIHEIASELKDRFGELPHEVLNLLDLIEIKSLCYRAWVYKIDVGPKAAIFSFYEKTFPKPDHLLAFVNKQKKGLVSLSPDGTITFHLNFQKDRLFSIKKLLKALMSLIN